MYLIPEITKYFHTKYTHDLDALDKMAKTMILFYPSGFITAYSVPTYSHPKKGI